MKTLNAITRLLVIVGALNWGLVALAEFDLVATVFGLEFGEVNGLTRVVYALVGLSALVQAALFVGNREMAPASSGHPSRA